MNRKYIKNFCGVALCVLLSTTAISQTYSEDKVEATESKKDASSNEALAEKFISNLSDEVVNIIKSDSSEEQKAQQLSDIFNTSVDIDWMAKFAIARFWKDMSSEQKDEYLKAYRNYLLKTYVPKFKEYNNQSIKLSNTKAIANDQYIVTIQIANGKNNDKSTINIGYRCKNNNGVFKIRDITGEDFSLLSTQRSEFSSIITNGGIDKLIKVLSEK